MRTEKTEVLVVGAGPVGLFTALQLAARGIDTTIIEREGQTSAHSYACALHQSTLALLEQFGLIDDALENGHRIDTVAFYEGTHRRAEVRLSEINAAFPFIVVVPQYWLEDALAKALEKAGVKVRWQHRFHSFKTMTDNLRVNVEKLGGSGFGYGVPHWESLVTKEIAIDAQYIIGADGPNSTIRRAGNFEVKRFGPAQFFMIYEFETDEILEEARVVMRTNSTDVLWPLPGGRGRWTFQLAPTAQWGDFPEKEREHVYLNEGKVEEKICFYARQIARDRAPWFTGAIKDVVWRTPVQFDPHIVSELGRDRCWLVGDAAHQTMPFGMQSMNAGLQESKVLTDALYKILREDGPVFLLRDYSDQTTRGWSELLDSQSIHLHRSAGGWVRQHCARIVSCIPALSRDLETAVEQLRFSVSPAVITVCHE